MSVELIQPESAEAWGQARTLVEEYAATLGVDLSFQNFSHELAHLADEYSPPHGAFLLAVQNGRYLGCVGLRKHAHGIGEIKRLYLAPAARGQGLGRLLAQAIVAAGRQRGYRQLLLDTLPSMNQAHALYASMGFKPTAPYRYNPVPGAAYLELTLDGIPLRDAAYLDNSQRSDRLSGGVRRIPIATEHGTFKVWTKRVGNNPRVKLLLLHGGPGCTHEYFEAFDSFLPAAGVEYYYYDQLGSYYSDQPDVADLWELPRFVDEVEQVRKALQLDQSNFFLLGHSWGGILALEYALKFQQHIKGLIISNMMASIPAYNEYAEQVLMPCMDSASLAEIQRLEAAKDFQNPRYMELLMQHHYVHHVLRMPVDVWPDPVERTFKHLNPNVYVPMQGPSELGASGKLQNWDQSAHLDQIHVPTLTIGAAHDTMDPAHMRMMAGAVKQGRFLECPNGSHMAMYDDQAIYMRGLIDFIADVDNGRF